MSAVVVCVCLDGQYKYLIGKESIFLRDTMSRETLAPYEYTKLPRHLDSTAIHGYFSEIARHVGILYNMRIQYDTPYYNPDTGDAHVRLRILSTLGYKYGVMKGGKELVDNNDLQKTAIREFREEVADIDIESKRFILKESAERNIYELILTHKEYTSVLEEIIKRYYTYYGELFEVQFLTKEEIYAKWSMLNSISKKALTVCFKSTPER